MKTHKNHSYPQHYFDDSVKGKHGKWIPLPYYIESPGEATDICHVLTVNGQEDKESGSL